MLCAKLGFAQSMDCPAQSHDTYFAQKSMDCAVIVQTVDSPSYCMVSKYSYRYSYKLVYRTAGIVSTKFLWEFIYHL